MVNKKAIGCFIGLEGRYYVAKALVKRFRRPVVCYVILQSTMAAMTPERQKNFDKVYSFPQFYEAVSPEIQGMSLEEINKQQGELEVQFGIATSTYLTSFDRSLRKISDYRFMREQQLAYLLFLQHVLQDSPPEFVVGDLTTFFSAALRYACIHLGIPHVFPVGARLSDRIFFSDLDGQKKGMREIFEVQQAGRSDLVDEPVRAQADAWYSDFIKRPHSPAYFYSMSRLHFSFGKTLRKILFQLSPGNFSRYRANKIDRMHHATEHPMSYIFSGIKNRFRAFHLLRSRIFEKSPDLNVPYIYVPLHFSPEIADIVYGTDYDHHEGFIFHLSKLVPSNVNIYVKENPSMVGNREFSFYSKLNKLYNVTFVHPRIRTFDLIQKSRAVIAVTGTAGWEAYVLNKPSIVLGKTFYNFLPGVLKTRLDEDFPKAVNEYLSNFKPDEQERIHAVRAYFAASYPGTAGDISPGGDVSRKDASRNAMRQAEAIWDFLKYKSHLLPGILSEDLFSTGETAAS